MPDRRDWLTALGRLGLGGALLAAGCAQTPPAPRPAGDCADPAWPDWDSFRLALVSDDGRVVDPAIRAGSTSEGQAYALFFALVAGQRAVFERLLRWTENNLAGGDLAARLPAWHWGPHADGRWDVIDRNAASDADLWLAYTLAQAGRLWGERRYDSLAQALARRIAAEEIVELPGLGATLLPGPLGFRRGEDGAKLNPSYLPPPLLRWFARHRGEPVWARLHAASLRLLQDSAPMGLAPDWVVYQPGTGGRGFGFAALDADERHGSYNAIRVYLWLGLTPAEDPARAALLARYAPAAALIARLAGMPVQLDPARPVAAQLGSSDDSAAEARLAGGRSPAAERSLGGAGARLRADGPVGFQAAVLPFLRAAGDEATLARLQRRVLDQPPHVRHYYDQVLALFGLGHLERRYRFDADGRLLTRWHSGGGPCDA